MKAIITYAIILILSVVSLTSCQKDYDILPETVIISEHPKGIIGRIEEEQPLVFVQMADTQIGMRDYQRELYNFRQAVDSINILKPDFVVICGDLVNTAGDEVYEDFLEIKDMLEVPIYLVAGNHDVLRVPTAKTLAYYRHKIGLDYYTFENKGYSFIVTNTQLWDEGPDYEMDNHNDWFENTMRVQEDNNTFVLGHYPMPAIGEVKRQEILDVLDEKNTIGYLSGHAHKYIEDEYNGVKLISARSLGYSFEGVEGYRVWTVSKDSVSHKFIGLKNK